MVRFSRSPQAKHILEKVNPPLRETDYSAN